IDAAVEAMGDHTNGSPENDRAWAFLLASEFARIYELADDLPTRARNLVGRCLRRTRPITEGIGEALRRALADHPGLALVLLTEGLSDDNVAAALMALPSASARGRAALGDHVDPEEVLP